MNAPAVNSERMPRLVRKTVSTQLQKKPSKKTKTDEWEKFSSGRDSKEETLEKWYHVASLHVIKGISPSQAYKQVYGAKDSSYGAVLFRNKRFLAIVERLRLSQCLDDDAVRKNIEALYLQIITDPVEQVKNKLTAASQWQKLRGLESQKVEIRSEVDDLILEQLKKCELAMQEQASIRAAKGRIIREELPQVEMDQQKNVADSVENLQIPEEFA